MSGDRQGYDDGPVSPAGMGDMPPPNAALLAAVAGMKPVRTRAPGRTALTLLAGGVVIVAGCLLMYGTRADLSALPVGWVAATALAWVMALLAVLLPAVLPRRGEVLPDAGRARRATLFVICSLVILGLGATVDAAGAILMPEATLSGFGRLWWHCTKTSLLTTLPFLVLAGLLLRRLFPVGGGAVAAALGASGGAIAGLSLHFTCPVGGGLHVGLAHGGGVAVGALAGMLLLPRLLRA